MDIHVYTQCYKLTFYAVAYRKRVAVRWLTANTEAKLINVYKHITLIINCYHVFNNYISDVEQRRGYVVRHQQRQRFCSTLKVK